MVRHMRSFVALLAATVFVLPAAAQTATTGGTTGATTTGATTTGATTTGGNMGGATATANRGTNTGAGAAGSTGSTFAGTVPSGFTGGLGATTATNTASGTGSTTSVPSTYNPWRTTYGNVYSLGQSIMGSTSTAKAGASGKGFGQPNFFTSTTGVGATGGQTQTATTAKGGFDNLNISKVPRYTTNLGEDVPYVTYAPQQMQSNLQNLLARSTALKNNAKMRVVVNDGTIFLVGQAGDERERRLAESLLLMTPGVRGVENRLVIPGQP